MDTLDEKKRFRTLVNNFGISACVFANVFGVEDVGELVAVMGEVIIVIMAADRSVEFAEASAAFLASFQKRITQEQTHTTVH